VIQTDNSPIEWGGRQYFEARELGFSEHGFVVSLFTTKPDEHRGSYFTCVPISPLTYRKKYPTKAAVRDWGTELIIYCDWGRSHRIKTSRSTIEKLLADADANEIPRLESPRQ